MGRLNKIDFELKKEHIIEDYQKGGYSYHQLAQKYNSSLTTIVKLLKDVHRGMVKSSLEVSDYEEKIRKLRLILKSERYSNSLLERIRKIVFY